MGIYRGIRYFSFHPSPPSFRPFPFYAIPIKRRLSTRPFHLPRHHDGIIHGDIRRRARGTAAGTAGGIEEVHINPESICSNHKNDIVDLAPYLQPSSVFLLSYNIIYVYTCLCTIHTYSNKRTRTMVWYTHTNI